MGWVQQITSVPMTTPPIRCPLQKLFFTSLSPIGPELLAVHANVRDKECVALDKAVLIAGRRPVYTCPISMFFDLVIQPKRRGQIHQCLLDLGILGKSGSVVQGSQSIIYCGVYRLILEPFILLPGAGGAGSVS